MEVTIHLQEWASMEYTRVGGLSTLFEEPQVLKKN
jgi:hypothetical protein